MSGILAIFHPEGQPVDRPLLVRMTESMAFRGPDARTVKVLDNVGLGHAMLRTTFESRLEKQPGTLTGEVWISADARVDGRAELRRELAEEGRADLAAVTDAELILHAYHAWGTDCPSRLIGDFAFVLWDRPRRRLFCARDQFGIKPLFYARVSGAIVVSNTIATLRLHPGISDTVDELAIADHLLFSVGPDPSITLFKDIRRLPSAHTLTWEDADLSITRYWAVPREEQLRYKNDQDYIDHFNQVFSLAVGDRLRCETVGVNMSGGLDSTSVAATAQALQQRSSRPCRVKAFTAVYERVMPDRERRWAAMVADHLKIPIHFTVMDDHSMIRQPPGREGHASGQQAPAKEFWANAHARALTDHTRVALTGFGGDPVNRGSSRCYVDPLKQGRLLEVLQDLRKVVREGKRPPLHLRTLWRRWRRKRRGLASYPGWINRDLEDRLDLRVRWQETMSEIDIGWSGQRDLSSSYWPWLLEGYDPGFYGYPIEYRHPYFDLRLVSFMLRVPPLPWFLGKVLVRKAMKGLLPDAVLARPKEVMASNPNDVVLGQGNRDWWTGWLEAVPSIDRFVDTDRLLEALDRHYRVGVFDIDDLMRVIQVATWLHSLGQKENKRCDRSHAPPG